MYSKHALKMRRCQGHNRDGSPCEAWALWRSSDQKCRWHTSDHLAAQTEASTTTAVCRCAAYPFPHRPGSGGCRWPDEPTAIHHVEAGTRGRRGPVEVTRFSWDATKQPLSELIAWFAEHPG